MDEAEKKVESLVKDKGGGLRTEPFIPSNKGNEGLMTSDENEAEEESQEEVIHTVNQSDPNSSFHGSKCFHLITQQLRQVHPPF
jgi:hypothetical protein